jgi:hypothetical protein
MTHQQEHFFENNIKNFSKQYQQSAKHYRVIAGVRLIVFISGIGTILFCANLKLLAITLWIGAAFLLILILVQKKLNHLAYYKSVYTLYIQVNQTEKARLTLDLEGIDNGTEYADSGHLYAQDLDLFGKHSLFALINRTTTSFGKNRLAQYLLKQANTATIKQRQQVVTELAGKVVWRQAFQVEGLYHKSLSARKGL